MRSGSVQLFRVMGIRVGADVSWFVVLFLFIWILSSSFQETLGGSNTEAYLTAVASALLFFVSLILHELGHALVARRQGIGINGIDLWFFGGIARVSGDTQSPGDEFKIAAAGPAVTLLVVAACVGVGGLLAGFDDLWDAARLVEGADVTPALLLISWLATINAIVFVFNLVPAFPLDGGRIARAVAWRVTGDRQRATRAAAALGQGFAYLMMGLGVYALISGGVVTGLWLVVLGLFLGQAARGAVVQTAFASRLDGVTVADIMDREPVAIPGELPVTRAHEEYFLRYRWPWFPVVDLAGRFVGVARQERVQAAEGTGDPTIKVSDVLEVDGAQLKVAENASLETLMASEPLGRLGALMAVDGEGILRGVVTVDQLRRALARAATPPGA